MLAGAALSNIPSLIPRVVGIGTSAGGLEALERFLQALQPTTGLAFVVVQHLSSDHESHLAELLRRQTSMQVLTVSGTTLIQPNVVYVRTPSEELRIDGSHLVAFDRISDGADAFYPIDRFFLSLAESRREKAIGIIMSGMGTDGTRGVDAIKENGGIVMVQSPLSAQFSGMPNSALRHEPADLVAPPEKLAHRLADLVLLEQQFHEEVQNQEGELSSGALARELIRLIQHNNRLNFTAYRPSTIRRRIEKRQLITQTTSNREYLELVKADQGECHTLAKSFLIGVTRFFRDREAFELIRNEVIPQLFANSAGDEPVRIWVPACSTGEEAYTMALLIEDYLAEQGRDRKYKILASDVDPVSVQTANQGFYQESIKADVPPEMLENYFRHELQGYRIISRIRERILFAVQDVLRDPPFIRVDLISCRNFLIYVNIEAQARTLSTFHFALNPNGFLLLGPSESLGKLQQAFVTLDRRFKLYARRPNNSIPIPSTFRTDRPDEDKGNQAKATYVADINSTLSADLNTYTAPTAPTAVPANVPMIRDSYAQYLADRYAPATLFVNETYDIVYINGSVDGLLRFPRQQTSFNLRRVLDTEASSILCSAIDSLLAEYQDNQYAEIAIPDLRLEDQHFMVGLKALQFSDSQVPLIAILLHPSETKPEETEGEGTVRSADELIQHRIRTLEEQLLQSNLKTQKLLSELEATNEELQTSNRELLASNEEMQSTNEELQSVNEELYTVNNEIQQKNEQLKMLNSDINNLLESTEIGTIFLDEDLCIRRFTPSVRKQFDLHASDVGRPIAAFTSSMRDLNLGEKCREVLATSKRYEEEVTDRKGQDILLRILPYRGLENAEAGLVVTFINISDLMEARRELIDMATKYQALLQHSQETIVIVGSNGKINEINKWVEGDKEVSELIGTYFVDYIENDSQRVIFDGALRKVFDEQNAHQVRLALRGVIPGGVHLDMAFISAHEGYAGGHVAEPQVMIIIRDITEQLRRGYHTDKIIEDYRQQLAQKSVQGGLIDPKGNIIMLNNSTDPERTVDDFLDHNVTDFLTASGKQTFELAMEKLANGSFEEIVHYLPEDLLVAPIGSKGTRVSYRPIIADNEIRLIGITAIDG